MRQCISSPVFIAAEAGEGRGRGVDRAHGLGDDDRAAAEAGRPVPPPGVVALDAAGLLLADVEPASRDESRASLPAVGAVEADTPALQAREEPLQGSSVATARSPVEEPARSPIPSLADPELVGPFFRQCRLVQLVFRQCRISSGSTTTARPSGSGFRA